MGRGNAPRRGTTRQSYFHAVLRPTDRSTLSLRALIGTQCLANGCRGSLDQIPGSARGPEDFLRTGEGVYRQSEEYRLQGADSQAVSVLHESNLRGVWRQQSSYVAQAEIEDWLSESDWAPRTRKNYLVTLVTLFEWARDRNYVVVNPAARIPKPILDDRPPGILSPAGAAKLLHKAREHDPELLSLIAIQLFAGLRRSEVCALGWNEIDICEKHLEVKGVKSKTRQRRLVTLQPPLMEFLEGQYGGTGHLWSLSTDHYGERLSQIAEKAEIQPWPHNALRHSFGSYFYALTKNENTVGAEMGTSPQMVFRHYRALVKPADCTSFWRIRPV